MEADSGGGEGDTSGQVEMTFSAIQRLVQEEGDIREVRQSVERGCVVVGVWENELPVYTLVR